MNFRLEVAAPGTLSVPAWEGDRVLSFDDWCRLNGFSRSTGRRLIKAGKAPKFVRLSARRIGVTVEENRRWQQQLVIDPAA